MLLLLLLRSQGVLRRGGKNCVGLSSALLMQSLRATRPRLAVYASCLAESSLLQCCSLWLAEQTRTLLEIHDQKRFSNTASSPPPEEIQTESFSRTDKNSLCSSTKQTEKMEDNSATRGAASLPGQSEERADERGFSFALKEEELLCGWSLQDAAETAPKAWSAFLSGQLQTTPVVDEEWLCVASDPTNFAALVRWLCEKGLSALVLRSVKLFDASSPLLPFLEFFRAFQQRRFAVASGWLRRFVEKQRNSDAEEEEDAAGRASLLSAGEVESLTKALIQQLLYGQQTFRRELLQLLHDAGVSKAFCLLHHATEIAGRCSPRAFEVLLSVPLQKRSDLEVAQDGSALLVALVQNHQFDQAREWHNLAGKLKPQKQEKRGQSFSAQLLPLSEEGPD